MEIFDEIYKNFKKINGFNGIMIMDNKNIIYNQIPPKVDTAKIQSMTKVISESSQKLLKRTNQGHCKTIIIEFQEINMILLNIENLQLLVLADKKAKLGHIILVSEKNRKRLHIIGEKIPRRKPLKDELELVETKTIKEEIPRTKPKEELDIFPDKRTEKTNETTKIKEVPEIKPPISLPSLEKEVKIPKDENERIELALKIYEHLLLAMSIGASKIMGVTPARGMLKKSLPYKQCPILEGVEVKANATIEFNTIKSNIKRSQKGLKDIIKDLNEIIWFITENYGRVMGYDAFRGMIRSEFKSIHEAYGHAIKELKIKDGIHPELKKLWESPHIKS